MTIGERTSEPCRDGVPPSTLATSFGVCQQSAVKIREAPMIEKASVAGWIEFGMFSAAASHVEDSVIPVLINRYSSMILTPIDMANEI